MALAAWRDRDGDLGRHCILVLHGRFAHTAVGVLECLPLLPKLEPIGLALFARLLGAAGDQILDLGDAGFGLGVELRREDEVFGQGHVLFTAEQAVDFDHRFLRGVEPDHRPGDHVANGAVERAQAADRQADHTGQHHDKHGESCGQLEFYGGAHGKFP
jgi:hypothetical protein